MQLYNKIKRTSKLFTLKSLNYFHSDLGEENEMHV